METKSTLYNEFPLFLKRYFSYKVQKISLNAGFTCPNRDGNKGVGGCTYCNNQTFNPDYCRTEKSITRQLEEGKQFFAHKYPEMKYLAYFQAYTLVSHHALTVAAHHGARRKQLPSKVLIMRRRTPALADTHELHARGSTPSDALVICRTTVYKYDTKNNGT